jgi:hypothetical protein
VKNHGIYALAYRIGCGDGFEPNDISSRLTRNTLADGTDGTCEGEETCHVKAFPPAITSSPCSADLASAGSSKGS